MHLSKETENIDDAISRYYDVQNEPTVPSLPTMDAEADTRNSLPPYARSAIRGLTHHHTNTFIEAAKIRSIDEVRYRVLLSLS